MAKVPTSPQDKSPFAEGLPAFIDALESLYIKSNLSGRNQFRGIYPHAAAYLFGPTLMEYDTLGGDKAQKALEEVQADERRFGLIDLIAEAKEKSVAGGVLQIQYIEGILHQLGPEIGGTIFSAWVIEKIFPPKPVVSVVKESPKDISGGFNAAPVETPAVKPAFKPNLGQKKKLVQVDWVENRGISYRDLVAYAQRLLAYSISKKFNLAAR